MSKISCTITSRSINVVLGGRMRTIPKGHMNFDKIEKLLRKINTLDTAPVGWRDVFRSREAAKESAEKRLYELLDVPVYIEKATAGRVRVTDKGVLFNDAPIHNAVTDQIMKLMHAGQDVGAMANFLDRLMSNPIAGVQEDLYAWIESGDMALTPDGCFLAFKKVGPDYASGHRAPDGSKVFNNIGAIVSMPREEVNTDRNHTCSQGLHFCSFQYLPGFGAGGGALDRVVIVKIAPEDVVAIPTDYNRSKGRTWKYEVIGEVPQEECEHLFKNKPLVAGTLEDPLGDVFFDDDEADVYDFWGSEADDNTVTSDQFEERVDQIIDEAHTVHIRLATGQENTIPDRPRIDENSHLPMGDQAAYDAGYEDGQATAQYDENPAWTQATVEDRYDQGYVDGYFGTGPSTPVANAETIHAPTASYSTYSQGHTDGTDGKDPIDDASEEYLEGYEDGLANYIDRLNAEEKTAEPKLVPVYRDGEVIAYRAVDE